MRPYLNFTHCQSYLLCHCATLRQSPLNYSDYQLEITNMFFYAFLAVIFFQKIVFDPLLKKNYTVHLQPLKRKALTNVMEQ